MRPKGTRASSTSPRRTRARPSSKLGPTAFSSACSRHPVWPPSRTASPAPATRQAPSARDGCAGELKSYAEWLLAYDNLPRKKAKFVNFAKNSLNLKADPKGIAEKLWLLIEAPKAEAPAAGPPAATAVPPPPPAAASAVSRSAEAEASAAAAGQKRKAAEAEAEAKEAEAEAKEAKRAKKEAKKKAKMEAGEQAEGKARAAAGGAEPTAKRSEGVVAVGAKPAGAAHAKPVKWKKIIAKELESEGGSMKLKELRSACVKEAKAHPSHEGRDGKALGEDFDAHFGTYTGINGKFVLDGKRVRLAPERG